MVPGTALKHLWEHLWGKQKEAFKEVMRISYGNCPKDNANYPEHHMIDEKLIAERTLNIEPIKTVKIPRTGDSVSKGPRIIYFWKF